SKTFNLAGLKCSVAIIPNASLREKFVDARVDLVSTVNVLGYTAAYAAYRDGQPWLEELLRYLEANRDFAIDYARTRLPGVRVATPEATYLAWLDCRNAGAAGADPFTFFLDKARVALHDGALFGPGAEGLFAPPGERGQRDGRVVREVLALLRPAIGVGRDEPRLVHRHDELHPLEKPLLVVAQVADHLRRGPALRGRAACENLIAGAPH